MRSTLPVSSSRSRQAGRDDLDAVEPLVAEPAQHLQHGDLVPHHDDAVQAGTLRHMPVPAAELETDGQPLYTFGGVGSPNADVVPVTGMSMAAAMLPGGPTTKIATPGGQVLQIAVPSKAEGLSPLGRMRQ